MWLGDRALAYGFLLLHTLPLAQGTDDARDRSHILQPTLMQVYFVYFICGFKVFLD